MTSDSKELKKQTQAELDRISSELRKLADRVDRVKDLMRRGEK